LILPDCPLWDSKIITIWMGGWQLARLDVVQSYYPYMNRGK
jgi:ribosome modulation factor